MSESLERNQVIELLEKLGSEQDEDVLAAANLRLQTLSQGRFELRHTERGVRRAGTSAGLEIEVFDEFTGTARPAPPAAQARRRCSRSR